MNNQENVINKAFSFNPEEYLSPQDEKSLTGLIAILNSSSADLGMLPTDAERPAVAAVLFDKSARSKYLQASVEEQERMRSLRVFEIYSAIQNLISQAQENFGSMYRDYPEEMAQALDFIIRKLITDRREKLSPMIEGAGYTAEQIKNIETTLTGYAPELRNSNEPGLMSVLSARFQLDSDALFAFSDASLRSSIIAKACHILHAFENDDARMQSAYALVDSHIADKWILDPPDILTSSVAHPPYKTRLVDQASRAICDPANKNHDSLYVRKSLAITPIPQKQNVVTRVSILDEVNDGLFHEMHPDMATMFSTIIILTDFALQQGEELSWTIDHVVRAYKAGGTAAYADNVIRITQKERDEAWDRIWRLSALGVLIEWQDEAKLRSQQYAPIQGPLINVMRNPIMVKGVVYDGLHLLCVPPLYEYAKAVGRIQRRDAKFTVVSLQKINGLNPQTAGIRRTSLFLNLQNYLECRIETMRRSPNVARIVRLDRAWINSREMPADISKLKSWPDLSRTEQKRFRDTARHILESFKSNGYITDFDPVKEHNGKINKFELTVPVDRIGKNSGRKRY